MLQKVLEGAGWLGVWAGSWLGAQWAGGDAAPQAEGRWIVRALNDDGEGAGAARGNSRVIVLEALRDETGKIRVRQQGNQDVDKKGVKARVRKHRALPRGDAAREEEVESQVIVIRGKQATEGIRVEQEEEIEEKCCAESGDNAQFRVRVLGKQLASDGPGGEGAWVVAGSPNWQHAAGPVNFVTLRDVLVQEEKDEEGDDSESGDEGEKAKAEAEVELELAADAKLSDYYIGVECYPVEEAFRKHLKLGDKGLWIQGVVEGSPASKAGFAQGDIILAAGDKQLRTVEDLVEVIDEAKDSPIAFKVLRDGERETIKVAPARRENADIIVNAPQQEDPIRVWERIRPGQDSRIQFFGGPGVIVEDDKYEFPEDLKISITRQGKSPAEIVVERGEERWEATSDKLDKLPEDIRPHVERMVQGGGPIRFMLRGLPERIQGDAAREGVARALERARAATARARRAEEEAGDRAGESDDSGEIADEAGDRLNRLMGRIEKLIEEKAEMLEKMLEEKAKDVEKRLEEKAQEAEEAEEDKS